MNKTSELKAGISQHLSRTGVPVQRPARAQIDLDLLARVTRKLELAIEDEALEDQVRLIGGGYNLAVNPGALFEGHEPACDELVDLLWQRAGGRLA